GLRVGPARARLGRPVARDAVSRCHAAALGVHPPDRAHTVARATGAADVAATARIHLSGRAAGARRCTVGWPRGWRRAVDRPAVRPRSWILRSRDLVVHGRVLPERAPV